MNKLELTLSRDLHDDHKKEVEDCFKDLNIDIDTKCILRKSIGEFPTEIIIGVGSFVLWSIASWVVYDLFKVAIKKIFDTFKNAKVLVRDKNAITYNIYPDNSVTVIVIPERKQEFAHIKNVDDLIDHLKKELKCDNI